MGISHNQISIQQAGGRVKKLLIFILCMFLIFEVGTSTFKRGDFKERRHA